jgi:hypothetical protein
MQRDDFLGHLHEAAILAAVAIFIPNCINKVASEVGTIDLKTSCMS